MKISFQSELMKNQKHAVVMAPDRAFEVLQSSDGDALFFSIGSDSAFYLTREVTDSSTGWNRLDLSSALASQHGGATVAAKAFSVAQNAKTLGVDLALVVTVSGQDHLYLSLGNANTDASWGNGVSWTAVPFDAGTTAPNPLTIADVFIMNIPAGAGGAVENIFADVVRTPGDPLNLLDRYYITPSASRKWNLHKLAADLAAGSISSCLGQRTGDPIPGIYTFGTINGQPELIFTPQYNYFRPTAAPSPARLTVPAGASAVASALNASGASNLFVAAAGGLYVFTPANQKDLAALVEGALDGLNATIDIPVISWVYQQVTGDDLSLLDLSCLIAAIPVTICYKLIANAAPFPDNATTSALVSAPDWASIQKIINNSPAMLTARPEGPAAEALAPAAISASGLSYLLYVAPDMIGQIPDLQNAKWWAIFNNAVSDLMVVKSMVDMGVGLTPAKSAAREAWDPVSPWLDFGGNIVWQVPTTAALFDPENQNTAGIISFFGGTCFDCNGILSPVLADDSEPVSWFAFVALAAFFNLAYGAMSCAASVLTFES